MNKKKILIADGSYSNIRLVNEVISQIDPSIKVDSFNNGPQLLAYLAKCPGAELPCLMILDYRLPIQNAAVVLEKMQHEGLCNEIPTIVWSASIEKDVMNRCMEAGAKNYFARPSKPSDLKALVKRMVEYCKS